MENRIIILLAILLWNGDDFFMKMTAGQFIDKARQVHGYRYNYNHVEYMNSKTPVKIHCFDHGWFSQRPDKHLQGHGCPVCARESMKQTNLLKYGVEYPLQNKDIYNKHTVNKDKVINDNGLSVKILELYNNGDSTADIASKLSISKPSVLNILKKSGIMISNSRTDIDEDELCRLYKSGMNVNQLSKKFNCSCDTVVRRLEKYGINPRKSGRTAVVLSRQWWRTDRREEYRNKIRDALHEAKIVFNEQHLRFDFFLSEYLLGIDIDGVYNSSSDLDFCVDPDTHQQHAIEAYCNNMGLLILYDEDFYDDRFQVVKNQLNRLSCKKIQIGARESMVKQISPKTAGDFLDKYHFQGREKNASVRYGMFYHDELIGVLCMGKPRFDKRYPWEIIRYCMSPYYAVYGCFMKLLSAFRYDHGICDIVSYMDMNKRLRAESVYDKNGFEFMGYTKPDYAYYNMNGSMKYSRYAATKKKLVAGGASGSLSEHEIMHELGYVRVYGAGSKKYVLHKGG